MGRGGAGKTARRLVVVLYLLALVVVPVALVFWNAFRDGLAPVIEALTDPVVVHALQLTLVAALWSVVLNAVFGVAVAIPKKSQGRPRLIQARASRGRPGR